MILFTSSVYFLMSLFSFLITLIWMPFPCVLIRLFKGLSVLLIFQRINFLFHWFFLEIYLFLFYWFQLSLGLFSAVYYFWVWLFLFLLQLSDVLIRCWCKSSTRRKLNTISEDRKSLKLMYYYYWHHKNSHLARRNKQT